MPTIDKIGREYIEARKANDAACVKFAQSSTPWDIFLIRDLKDAAARLGNAKIAVDQRDGQRPPADE